jgi:hypothetical protein
MSQIRRLAVVAVATTMMAIPSTQAQDITGFEQGYLTFTNENPTLYYRIEFRPNLTGPEAWDGTFRGLRNIHSDDFEITVPVGLFYRVVGRETPWIAGTASANDILSGRTAYVSDEEITGAMTNVGQTNIMPGTAAHTIPQGYHDGTGEVAGDANLVAGNIKQGVTTFGVTGTYAGSAAVPKTGQTTSYRTGDDGNLQKGVASPVPRFTDHGNGTVTDNLTGLMWVQAPHAVTGNLGTKSWINAIDFCKALSYAGYSDWRLPHLRELQSLIDYQRFLPPLDPERVAFVSPACNAGTTVPPPFPDPVGVELLQGSGSFMTESPEHPNEL